MAHTAFSWAEERRFQIVSGRFTLSVVEKSCQSVFSLVDKHCLCLISFSEHNLPPNRPYRAVTPIFYQGAGQLCVKDRGTNPGANAFPIQCNFLYIVM